MTNSSDLSSKFYILLILIFTLQIPAFSQSENKLIFGNLTRTRISAEDFKNQKKLFSTEGLKIDSAVAYFSIPGQPLISSVEYLPNCNRKYFLECTNKLIPGAWINFEAYCSDKNHKKQQISVSYVIYSMTETNYNTIVKYYNGDSLLKKLNSRKYIKGTIYFSGTYFKNVILFNVENANNIELEKLFLRCTPGTIISFENVSYLDENGILVLSNETFKL